MSDGEFQVPEYPQGWIDSEIKRNPTTGVDMIAKERFEQKTKHKRTIEDDVKFNKQDQLREAAFVLLADDCNDLENFIPKGWDPVIWKHMVSKPIKERLIIAGALIAAEIDRLNFKEW